MKVYFDIMILYIEKNIYDIVFGQPNKDPEIDLCLVPSAPLLFASYHNSDLIEKRYENILIEVKEAMLNDTYQELPKYSVYQYESFNLKTIPEE